MSFGGGFGSGGFGQTNNTNTGSTFGGFGANNTNTTPAFGSTPAPAFGAASTTGGGLFGGSSGGGAFGGNTGGFGSTTNSAFGAPKPAFGTAPTTSSGGGLFGGSTTATAGTGSGFGGFGTNNTASSGFGSGSTMFGQAANKPTGFGTTTAPAAGTGGLFGGSSGFGSGNTTTPAFGQATNTATGPVPDPPGTAAVPFAPYQEKETNGAQNSFQNIVFQDPYKKYSPEELRLVDYAQGRQFGNGTGAAAGAFGTSSGFGGGSTFGSNTQSNTGFGSNTGGGLFGSQQQNTNTGFGAANTTNNTSSSPFGGGGGLFGQNKPATGGLFGNTAATQPAQQTGGLFGNNNNNNNNNTNTTGAFGSTGTGGFGSNNTSNTATSGLFGAKPATTGFGSSFGNTATNNTSTPFGGTGTGGAFGSNTAANTTTGGLFGNQSQNSNTGGLFGNQQNQQQAQPGGFGSSTAFGQNNQQQQTGGGLFGNQQKPATGLFGNTAPQSNAGGLFGQTNNNATTGFGQTNAQQQQPAGGLFGAKPAGTTGGLFGQQPAQQQTGQTGGLFSSLGGNNQPQQQQTTSLFGQQNQQKPSLFGPPAQQATGGLFGQQQQQQPTSSMFGNSIAQQPQQNSLLGNSLFNTSQNAQSTPQSLTASISDLNAFGTPSLFAGLGTNDVQNPGPLATPLSSKNKSSRKASILPMWKLNPGSGSKFVTPVKRGYGFSYSTYGSPVTPSSNGSTPGAFGQSLLGAGNLNRSLSKSFSSTNLRRSINAEDSILSPGSFSASMGPRPYGSARFNKLTIDKSLRIDLFSPVSKGLRDPNESPNGPRKIAKRVSFDTSNVETSSPATAGSPQSPPTSAPELGYGRNQNGEHANGITSRSPNAPPEMEQVTGKELPTVHEESPPTSRSTSSAFTPGQGPGEYWMSPSIKELSKMNRVQLSHVSNFTVGRDGVGYVNFKAPVDLNNIEINKIPGGIVILDTRSCTVYPEDLKKPPMGKGLNVPSEISLLQSWPRNMDKRTGQPIKSGRLLEKHINKLRNSDDTTFISYDPETGNWVFEVEHFTTYGLFDDGDETDGDTLADITVDDVPVQTQSKQARNEEDTSPAEPEEDTFDFKRKRRALPGAFDYTGHVSDDEEEMVDANQQSFLFNRSAGSASQALVHQHEDEDMDAEHALPEDQEPSAYLGYHQAAEPEFDSPYYGSMAEYQETPGGIMRARMQAIKGANSPVKIQVADGDDWMDMLQKTISPLKRDRAALKTIHEAETYESLKESTRQMALTAKPKSVPDGRGFATSIELMNSLFEKPKTSVRPAQATIPTSGFKFPYKRQDKNAEEEDGMDPNYRAFHDALRPSWGPDGTLVLGTAPKVPSRSSKRAIEKDGIMSMSRLNIVSENRDVRFAKFTNESSAKALTNQISLTSVEIVNNVPTVSLGPVSSLTSFFHGQDLQSPANAHEKMVWELASILFDQITDAEGTQVAPTGLRSARRRNLSKFWEGIVEEVVNRSVGMARTPEDKAIAALSGHRVPDACKHLSDGKNFRLATVVSMIGANDQMMQDMKEQVRGWRDANVLSEFTDPIRVIYELLSGNVCAVDGKKGAMENRMDSFVISDKFGMDWRQAFGLRLWYAITSQDDVVEAIRQYEDDLSQDKEKSPKPWFAEQGIQTLWEDPDVEHREDLLWGLLKLYADKDTDLADVLRPENSQLSPLDFRLCWQLGQALINTGKVTFGEDVNDKTDAATLSFASQLTGEGNWLEAVFVLLHLTNPTARAKAIQEHLSRHARLIGSEQSEEFITLTQVFKIPATWVWQAKALYQRAVKKDAKSEVLFLLRAHSHSEAHKTLVKHVAPQAIIERDYAGLWDLLEQFSSAAKSISDWNLGGKIYTDFLELVSLVHAGRVAEVDQKVVTSLMQGLPAMREQVQVRGDADVLEVAAVADMANVTAQAVVALAKKGEIQLQKVLGLPLTEDAYLRYSNELAFAYYRNVMVGS